MTDKFTGLDWKDPDVDKPLHNEPVMMWFNDGHNQFPCYMGFLEPANDHFEERWYPAKPFRWAYVNGPHV